MNKCRWCDLVHGPMCPAVKALEYADDGVTVRRVEFKVATDYCLPMPIFSHPVGFPANPWSGTWSGGPGSGGIGMGMGSFCAVSGGTGGSAQA